VGAARHASAHAAASPERRRRVEAEHDDTPSPRDTNRPVASAGGGGRGRAGRFSGRAPPLSPPPARTGSPLTELSAADGAGDAAGDALAPGPGVEAAGVVTRQRKGGVGLADGVGRGVAPVDVELPEEGPLQRPPARHRGLHEAEHGREVRVLRGRTPLLAELLREEGLAEGGGGRLAIADEAGEEAGALVLLAPVVDPEVEAREVDRRVRVVAVKVLAGPLGPVGVGAGADGVGAAVAAAAELREEALDPRGDQVVRVLRGPGAGEPGSGARRPAGAPPPPRGAALLACDLTKDATSDTHSSRSRAHAASRRTLHRGSFMTFHAMMAGSSRYLTPVTELTRLTTRSMWSLYIWRAAPSVKKASSSGHAAAKQANSSVSLKASARPRSCARQASRSHRPAPACGPGRGRVTGSDPDPWRAALAGTAGCTGRDGPAVREGRGDGAQRPGLPEAPTGERPPARRPRGLTHCTYCFLPSTGFHMFPKLRIPLRPCCPSLATAESSARNMDSSYTPGDVWRGVSVPWAKRRTVLNPLAFAEASAVSNEPQPLRSLSRTCGSRRGGRRSAPLAPLGRPPARGPRPRLFCGPHLPGVKAGRVDGLARLVDELPALYADERTRKACGTGHGSGCGSGGDAPVPGSTPPPGSRSPRFRR